MPFTSRLLIVVTFVLAATSAHASELLSKLSAAAPNVDPAVLSLALQARDCATIRGAAVPSSRLAVIDYSRPSTERRLWVFDLNRTRLLHSEFVAHGQGSGENMTRSFSNRDGSHQTSLGLFTTGETYVGGNGYSLRMDGLEPGFNDNARGRLIVMHGAPYVNPANAVRQGRLGRSHGCPALRPEVAREVIDELKQGQMLFSYYPNQEWLASSRFLNCESPVVAGAGLAANGAHAAP